MIVTEEMVNRADSILSRSRPGIPDEVIRHAIAAAIAEATTQEDRTHAMLETIVAPDNGTSEEVLSAVLQCAKAWVPEARIVGNVRAGDIARAIEAALSAQPQTVEGSSIDARAFQSWVFHQRVSLHLKDPDYFVKCDVWKAVGAQIRLMLAAAPKPTALTAAPAQQYSDDETYEIGKRDGYEEAVQEIDQLTGGDGEYRFCTDHDPDRHTPGPAEMMKRIAERFEALNLLKGAEEAGRDQEWGISAETTSPQVILENWQLVPKEPNDEWAERYCKITNKHPDGMQSTSSHDGWVTCTFRDISKREIAAMLASAPCAAETENPQ
ncbi:hypothetical protein RvVAR031_36450 [Agrobacterium vitis]|uniref:hypothetical protein n=1 Tax=Agrobacterium vitis TaxID=373 RepID=UPI0015D96CE6|nr:hypothetical protein [Agrobacterium vitis]BCH56035.1 hypothetical protein RvVAR031_36450 [Agrobacterium vitis]